MTICGLSSFAQTSTSVPNAPASRAESAIEPPSAPVFEYLGRLRAEIGTRTVVENGPQGTRTIVQIVGGRFEGPRVKASVQTPSGDWITNRVDGSYRLDVRLTLKTDDGALILVTYNGIGQTTDAGASLRAAPLFETGDSRYTWLTRLHGEVVGGIDLTNLQPGDVVIQGHKVWIHLPTAQVFSTRIDNAKTKVYSRDTGLFSSEDPNLESEVREEAERQLQAGSAAGRHTQSSLPTTRAAHRLRHAKGPRVSVGATPPIGPDFDPCLAV